MKGNYSFNDFLIEEIFGKITVLTVNHFNANFEIAGLFKEYASKVITNKVRYLIVDLSYVNYIDSTFLGALVYLLKRLNKDKGNIKLVLKNNSYSNVVFELTNLDKVFKVYDSVEEAKNSFILPLA